MKNTSIFNFFKIFINLQKSYVALIAISFQTNKQKQKERNEKKKTIEIIK